MSSIKVMGHTPPDTDTVCSPIVYSWYLNTHKEMDTTPVRAGKINKETEYVLNRFGVTLSENVEKLTSEDQVIIIDTNNPEELVAGWQDATILEIVDHHKLIGGLATSNPIDITTRTVGCSATILWEIMHRRGEVEIPKELLGLMLSCILSDTLKFASPTTTPEDKRVAEIIAEKINVDIDELAEQMFDAKSSLEGMSAMDIIKVDSKIFPLADKKVRISVLETVRPNLSLGIKEEIKKEMVTLRDLDGVDAVLFFIVDILNNSATALTYDDYTKGLVEKGFGVRFEKDDMVELPGVVSRKKQIVPNIEKGING